jgi:hypothetical protein
MLIAEGGSAASDHPLPFRRRPCFHPPSPIIEATQRSRAIQWEEAMVRTIAIAIALGIAMVPTSRIVDAEERPAAEIGRYQVVVLYTSDASALLIDTVTGRSWVLGGKKAARAWSDLNFGRLEGDHMALTPAPCTRQSELLFGDQSEARTKKPSALLN